MAVALQHSLDSQLLASGAEVVVERLERLEAEVAAGIRDARSLVLIPREIAARAELTFPENPYGAPQDW